MEVAPKQILLSQIKQISPLNPRVNVPADANIPALAASIMATKGPVQNLVVRPMGHEASFEVLVGRRRFLAMQSVLSPSTPIYVDIFVGDDGEAELYSLAEQTQREQLHPAEEVRSFAALVKQGFSPAEIARDFGCEERTVRQRLALGGLHQRILDAWRDGSLPRESVEAFTATDDPEKQVELFEHAPQHRRNPTEIRRRLRGDAVRADHALARFVTLPTYAAAGGRTEEDLFAEDAWLMDGAKLRDLAERKLAAIGEALVKREGWGWVRTQFDQSPRARWREAEDVRADWTDGDHKRLDEIEAELVTLASTSKEAGDLVIERDNLEAKAWTRGVKAARRKKLGVWVSLDYQGGVDIERGLEPRPEREETNDSDDYDEGGSAPTGPKMSSKDQHSLRVAESLCRDALGVAVSQTLRSAHESMILALTLAGLACQGYGNVTGFSSDSEETSDPLLNKLRDLNFPAAAALAIGSTDDEVEAALRDLLCTAVATPYGNLLNADLQAIATALIADGWRHELCQHMLKAFDQDAYLKALPPSMREAIDTQLDIEGWLPDQAKSVLGELTSQAEPHE